ncbi:glycosyltransferase family 2 protein [Rhizobium sp. CG5]|uniref:glycosyltransferase family 2 protein n=1 Tax=Rhizobium sp. CG5 TaxID=2726076 RepID=UPI002033252E|nr:glycosyltransferase family 2 protein [Rhizobium sp. CG5]MCM2476089.1 glycosyltransferase family 2 protein [Rhizobium sp. CG5]
MSRLAAVILTYNSDDDLPACLVGLSAQEGIQLDVIVVDNASDAARRERMRTAFRSVFPSGHMIEAGAALPVLYRSGDGLFVENGTNAGYSAGNNIGARIATAIGCAAILIINPDVRIAAPDYLVNLSDALFRDDRNAIAGSSIRNLSGANENPMFEPSFLQELLLPARMIAAAWGMGRDRPRAASSRRVNVTKLSGCCFLIRGTFLRDIGFFDQTVFLYCEEAILAAQANQAGQRLVYVADIEAVHAHRPSSKGDPVRRQRLWSRSRRYYHARYLGYGGIRRAALAASHGLIIALTWAQSRVLGGV